MFLRFALFFLLATSTFYFFNVRKDRMANAERPTLEVSSPFSVRAVKMAVSEQVVTISAKERQIAASGSNTRLDLGRRVAAYDQQVERTPDASKHDRTGFPGKIMPAPMLSFDGLANHDNVNAFGLIIAPPDMVGEAGPDHYLQVVNTLFRVHSKSGQALTPPIPINSIFQNLGTPCSNRNDGLPNLIYDQFADRWLISQVCSIYPPFRQMIAVSQTGDPLGAWFAYEFVMPNVKINDFPKMSLWIDGYIMTTNEVLGSDYTGTGIFAFDRRRMIEGDPDASYVYFSMSPSTSFPVGVLPADIDGFSPPPDRTPAIIATHTATEYGHPADALRLFDLHADFASPSASYLQERPESPITVLPFDPTSPDGRADISQPAPGAPLDSVSDTLMPRLAYRNFGSHQSLVMNQTVRTSPVFEAYRAGVRVYELRNSNGIFEPVVQSTIGDTSSSRWIGSAAQDNQGNFAVQYNLVSDEKPVSIVYAGRTASEPPNALRAERSLIDGTGVQKGFGWRWGEYSAMSVDPLDDCTFWVTNAYYTLESQQFSDWGWLTRIGNFKFDECTAAPFGAVAGRVTNAATGDPINDASVTAGVYSRRSSLNGVFSLSRMPPGEYQIAVSKSGFEPAHRSIDLAKGETQQQDFALEPVPEVVAVSSLVTAESCGLDRAIDPGESVTIDLALRNTGAADIAALEVQLAANGGVTVPGPMQNFGPMPAGSETVRRPFTFTADPNLKCGSPLHLSFLLFDDGSSIGELSITLETGRPRIAFSENFDRTPLGGLPPRWSRQAFAANGTPDAPRNWHLSGRRAVSGTKSLFSPAPIQPGTNEVASPTFVISTNEARLTFQNWYELETTFLRNRLFDGSVLEIRIGDGIWQDILAAGGSFVSGGYDGPIDACCQNPFAGRQGWSGWSGINRPAEFVTTEVTMPQSAAGQKVQLRWRVGTDLGTFREGQYIDDVKVIDGRACHCR